ncbi:MAG TPA: acyltransferase family protein [Noviherbaspirillum sp.]
MQHEYLPMNSRIDWVDYAKGICIVWVVTLYSTNFVQTTMQATGWMQFAVDFATPFRMPDFFLLSGLFVPRIMKRPLRTYIDSKFLYFGYFYAVWATLKFVNMEWHVLLSPQWPSLIPAYLQMYVEPPTGPLWFLYTLAVFFVAVRAMRRLPTLLVLGAAIALQLAVADTEWSFKVGDKFSRYFVFFYSGYLLSPHVFRAAQWISSRLTLSLALFAAWFAVELTAVALRITHLPGMQLALGYAGAFAIELLASLLCRLPWMGWLRYLGRHSLIVYLGFVVPMGLMRRFVETPPISDVGTLSLAVTVLSIGGALLLYHMVRATPVRFLFERPAWASLGKRTLVAAESAAPV